MNQPPASADDVMNALIVDYTAALASEVDDVLAKRRTIRAFTDQPIEKAVLDAILAVGERRDRRLFAEDRGACGSMEALVVVRRVRGLAVGVHTIAGDPLVWEFNGPLPESAWRAIHVAPTMHTAPVLIVPTGNFAAAHHHFGAHGHLRTRRRAGAIAYTMWLAALAAGLSGGITGAVRPNREFRRLGRCDPLQRSPLAALAIGYPDGDTDG